MNHAHDAIAIWYECSGRVGLRSHNVPAPPHDHVSVAALHSAVSRGTERLVLSGAVPPSEYGRMRGPHQDGDFPFPVKYGYAVVGRIESGPRAGETVFVLHPHQSRFTVPREAALPVPAGVPPRRATLAANLETALTVAWDSGASLGDRVLVVGAGVVGLLIARLLAGIPGAAVTVADTDPGKAAVAAALGARFAAPATLADDFDVAINASASAAGLDSALAAAGPEARVVEASWHGARPATVHLGGAFHSRRLTLAASQVGRIPPARAPRWSHRRRLELALALTADPALDALLTHAVPLAEAPARLPGLLRAPGPLAITIDYG